MFGPHNLQRFVDAQDPVIDRVRAELRVGRKATHWMWFVFPQIAGLGDSALARRFAIGSRAEAEAYLDHPVLGRRLIECTALINAHEGRSIHEILGAPDDLKFHSSMTLFASAAPHNPVFAAAIQIYFGGEFDRATIERL